MKILFLAHRTPYPPNKGDKIRSYNILSQLAHRHTVSLAYWIDDPADINHATALSPICRGEVVGVRLNPIRAKARAFASLAQGNSFSEGYYYSRRFQRILDRMVERTQPALVYVFSSAMARYVERFHYLPRIVDFVDVDSGKWGQLSSFANFPLSWLYRMEQKRLARLEVDVSCWARFSLFVSKVEADLFREIGGRGTIVVLPNGVAANLRCLPVGNKLRPGRGGNVRDNDRPLRLLFTGTLNYYPNFDAVLYFAREILPKIRRQFPQAIFEIVGRFPPRSVRKLDGRDGIRLIGEVNEIQSFLAQAEVSVAPLRIARGVQNKVLEAMAAGVPVVATSEAVKGIRVTNGDEVLVGDSPDAFAAQVIRVLSEGKLRTRIIQKAWQKVHEDYDWQTIGARLDNLIEKPASGLPKNGQNFGELNIFGAT